MTGNLLSRLLHAIATGYSDRAKNLVGTSEELTDEERARLWPIVDDEAASPAEQSRRVGDALRELGANRVLPNECYRLAFYLGASSAELTDNPLYAYFAAHRSGRLLDKWVHYFPVYDRHLARYRGSTCRVLEIGVFRGGSLDMWERYLGPAATLIGIDIDKEAARLADPRHLVLIGDQADREFLASVVEEHGPFDIVIDDGGHAMEQQINSIDVLFPALIDGGVYIVEDCHTSYWEEFGGGLGRTGTFIEWVKQRIDDLHGYHRTEPVEPMWTESVDAIHCYDSVVVIDKQRSFPPFCEQMGTSDFLYNPRSLSDLVGELLATRDAAIAQREEAIRSSEADRQRIDSALEVTRNDLLESQEQLRSMRRSASWRVTAPLRLTKRRLRDSP